MSQNIRISQDMRKIIDFYKESHFKEDLRPHIKDSEVVDWILREYMLIKYPESVKRVFGVFD